MARKEISWIIMILVHFLSTWEVKSCCCSCRPSLRSQDRTVLSRPPVQSLVPSLEMSIQLAPSVWPWNCLQEQRHTLSQKYHIIVCLFSKTTKGRNLSLQSHFVGWRLGDSRQVISQSSTQCLKIRLQDFWSYNNAQELHVGNKWWTDRLIIPLRFNYLNELPVKMWSNMNCTTHVQRVL